MKTHTGECDEDSPDVIGPEGNLQLSEDLRRFLDSSLKLKHVGRLKVTG